ncbi:deoxyribose-phosphate aldolase [Protomyces lactucae-debilis]|uniref:deoxyribose-phosphate aldolase n=1 Tax=Protomyces lactucae-debilis TaxID=2754530 RepID=A0A1Y2F5B3_PROLT|nr:deoxyribose-phosphate aldolase [Protomyces lactucae-debilis]ORY78125.1 deoxyribose-phosphate aldolase [Protomyces lactucae-debilis]
MNRLIDHTILKPDATKAEVEKICDEALALETATVCVNTRWLPLVSKKLANSNVLPIAVVGFPLGACLTEAKVFETKLAIQQGAKEIDMVIDVGALKDGEVEHVEKDIHAVVQAAGNIPVKVILETCLLTDEQKRTACKLCKKAGAAFVKTSTGFSKSGATVADTKLMREEVGKEMGVKASGGIRTFKDAQAMVDAGASRIGASASVAIMAEANASSNV